MTQAELIDHINRLGVNTIDRESQPGLILFKQPDTDRIFAIIHDGTNPLRVEAKCDPQLSKLLRGKYESVLASANMDKKSWNEIICSGQLNSDEVKDLVTLAYHLSLTNPD